MFSESQAAQWWNRTLDDWFNIPREARAVMIATYEAIILKDAAISQEMEIDLVQKQALDRAKRG